MRACLLDPRPSPVAAIGPPARCQPLGLTEGAPTHQYSTNASLWGPVSMRARLKLRANGLLILRACVLVIFPSVALGPVSVTASDHGLTSRQMEIVQTVLNVDGYITAALHREFWGSVPDKIRNDLNASEAFVRVMEQALIVAIKFQRETWASINASLKSERVVKTEEYESAKKEVLESQILLPERRQIKRSVAHAEGMIEAAAKNTPFQSPKGPLFVTQEMVDQVLAGMDGSLSRFRQLMNPQWRPKLEEHRYPEARVKILSDTPFNVERRRITAENGRTAYVVNLMKRASENDFVTISFIELGDRWADPVRSLIRTARSTLLSTGINTASIVATTWRGLQSAEGTGATKTSKGSLYASVRVAEVPSHLGAIVFFVVTEKSVVDALELREELERTTQITN